MNAGQAAPYKKPFTVTEINLIVTKEYFEPSQNKTDVLDKFHLMAQVNGRVVFSAEGETISKALKDFADQAELWENSEDTRYAGMASSAPMGASLGMPSQNTVSR